MDRAPYRLSETTLPRLGLIVLQVDETIEDDMRRLIPWDRARLHITRIPSGADLNTDTIAQMERDLPAAAGLLPQAVDFDAVGYGCTSGATLIGPARVGELVQSRIRTRAVTNPMSAALAAFDAADIRSIGIVSPYVESVSTPLTQAFENAGISVAATLSFGEEVEARVARINPDSIRDATRALGCQSGVDAVFLSCTNLRTLDILDGLAADLDRPVLSSNQVLGWHMMRLAGVE